MASESGDKTHDPTPQRRNEFKKSGKIPRARDAAGIASISAVLLCLVGLRGTASRAMGNLFHVCLGDLTAIGRGDGDQVMKVVTGTVFALVVPVTLAAAGAAATATMAQVGLNFYPENLALKPERLNPLPKLLGFFSLKRATTETLINLSRVAIIGYVAYTAIIPEIPRLLALTTMTLDASFDRVIDLVLRLTMKLLGALAILGAIDYAQSKFSIEKEMKMTLQEVKEEQRAHDGDPKVKGRIRGRARALARKRMMNDVKKADVVVTNPTHVAVALRYGAKDVAPVVLAKGHDDVALQIRAEARRYGIPIIESRALARALDAEVQVGNPIPGAHYAAVAQVLAFVYRIRGRKRTPTQARAS